MNYCLFLIIRLFVTNNKHFFYAYEFFMAHALLKNPLKSCYFFPYMTLLKINSLLWNPMAESFVAVCDMLLKFHNLSAKYGCNFNE